MTNNSSHLKIKSYDSIILAKIIHTISNFSLGEYITWFYKFVILAGIIGLA
jgi:hypothetical protein